MKKAVSFVLAAAYRADGSLDENHPSVAALNPDFVVKVRKSVPVLLEMFDGSSYTVSIPFGHVVEKLNGED